MVNVLKLDSEFSEMEWDCRLMGRIRGSALNCKKILALSVILVISCLSIGETFYLDCDQIQRDGHCECTKLEQYSIDCPSNRSIYPIQLKCEWTHSLNLKFYNENIFIYLRIVSMNIFCSVQSFKSKWSIFGGDMQFSVHGTIRFNSVPMGASYRGGFVRGQNFGKSYKIVA